MSLLSSTGGGQRVRQSSLSTLSGNISVYTEIIKMLTVSYEEKKLLFPGKTSCLLCIIQLFVQHIVWLANIVKGHMYIA
jgi:hypothetical protein